jgi:glycosyltransferase involved in cell wall biosynthesis
MNNLSEKNLRCLGSQNPLVTIIIPCYRLAYFLSQCVSSVLNQTYQDYEILIMDNCSPDNTPEIAASFKDGRVKHIRNEENIGHIRNFNKGISIARGKYIWLLSADDALRSSRVLERYVDLMERNPRVGYVFCRAVEWRGAKEGRIVAWADCGSQDRIWKGPSVLPLLILGNRIVWSSTMVRKECYLKVGNIPVDMPFASDWYMWCVFALHYDVAYFAEPMVFFREHEESLTNLFNSGQEAVGIRDELAVLFRVRREMERTGVRVPGRFYKASIANRASLALHSGRSNGVRRPGLSEPDFHEILTRNSKDVTDEEEIRACVYDNLGDRQYFGGEFDKAKRSYRIVLRLRPWWLGTWARYLLLQAGRVGGGERGSRSNTKYRRVERAILGRRIRQSGRWQWCDVEGVMSSFRSASRTMSNTPNAPANFD